MAAPPEQIDFRTDLFLVGLVTYEALTGEHPFIPSDPAGYFQRLTSGDIANRPLDGARVPDSVRGFLRRLLQPAPNRRYRTPARAREACAEAFST